MRQRGWENPIIPEAEKFQAVRRIAYAEAGNEFQSLFLQAIFQDILKIKPKMSVKVELHFQLAFFPAGAFLYVCRNIEAEQFVVFLYPFVWCFNCYSTIRFPTAHK